MTKVALTRYRQRMNYVGMIQSLATVGITATLASATMSTPAEAQDSRIRGTKRRQAPRRL
jgi:hypothetical protein